MEMGRSLRVFQEGLNLHGQPVQAAIQTTHCQQFLYLSRRLDLDLSKSAKRRAGVAAPTSGLYPACSG
jgi:hypothetical protein